ncbi:MAG: hypothetical protein JKY23_07130, partial [Nitrospinaceae bacterium]|nr:hypothetical protein [Nitrospinaceae bacterium]
QFDIQPDETDLPTFPLFGLFSSGLGMTSIIPDMDSTKPARVDPKTLLVQYRILKFPAVLVRPLYGIRSASIAWTKTFNSLL